MDQRHQAFINEAAGIRAAQHAISEVREIIDERETKNLGGASSSYVLQLQVEDLEGILREVTDARLARKLGVEESTTLRNRGSGNISIDGGGADFRGGAVEDDQDVDGDPESMDLLRFVVATAGEIINSVAPPAPSPTVKGKEKSPIGARPRPPPTRTTASSGSRASLSTSPKRTSGSILRLSVPRASTSLTRSPNRSRNTNLMRLSPLTDVRTKAATPMRLVTASATVPPGNAYSDKGKGRAIDGSESKVAPELNLVLSGCNEVQGTDGGSTAQPALELGSDNQLRLGLPGPSGEIGLLVSDNSGKTLQNISAEEAEAVHKSIPGILSDSGISSDLFDSSRITLWASVSEDVLSEAHRFAPLLSALKDIVEEILPEHLRPSYLWSSLKSTFVPDFVSNALTALYRMCPVFGGSRKEITTITEMRQLNINLYHIQYPPGSDGGDGQIITKGPQESDERPSEITSSNASLVSSVPKLMEHETQSGASRPLATPALQSAQCNPVPIIEKSCTACGDNLASGDQCLTAPCEHAYCPGCVQNFVELYIRDESIHPLRCCNRSIPTFKIESFFVSNRGLLISFLAKREEYSTSPDSRIYCPGRGCNRFISSAFVMKHTTNGTFTARCPACHCPIRMCVRCKEAGHPGEACDAKKNTIHFQRLVKEEGWQTCSRCQRIVERIEGCLHMTCLCGYEFCYRCGAKYQGPGFCGH